MQTVCLIGKPNVGKSSIFNRLIKEKKAIIMDTPGITRDRIYGIVNYNKKRFSLIDTGGISLGNDNFDKDKSHKISLADIFINILLSPYEEKNLDYIIKVLNDCIGEGLTIKK